MRWALATAVLLVLPAAAGGTQFAVSRTPLDEGGEPQLARSERSGAIVAVWGVGGEDVHAALLAPDGRRVSPADRHLGPGRHPAIAYDATADRFLVVTETLGATRSLRGLLLDGEGLPLGVPFTIADAGPPTAEAVGPPAVADAPAGGFTVAFTRVTDPADGRFGTTAVVVRGVGADGTPGAEHVAGTQGDDPAIAPGLVAWRTRSSRPGAVGTRRLDASGAPLGTEVTLTGAPRPLVGPPAVAQDAPRGRWVVAYLDDRPALQLVRIGADGRAAKTETAPARGAQVDTRPALALGGGGELDDALVAWRARQVHARPLALDGLRAGARFRVSSGAAGAETSPAATLAGDRAVVAYDAAAPSSGRARIAARRFTPGEAFDVRPPRLALRRRGLRVRIRCSEPCSLRVLRSPPFRRLRGRVYGRRHTLVLERRGRVRVVARDRAGNPRAVSG